MSEHSDPGYPCVKKGEENSDASATTSVVSLQVERGGGADGKRYHRFFLDYTIACIHGSHVLNSSMSYLGGNG